MKLDYFGPLAIIALVSVPAAAAGLPSGTCKGGGMTVTVQGGTIQTYKYAGKSYAVTKLSDTKYKIGSAGQLSVRDPKDNKFKGTFSMSGYFTPATFTCN